MKTKITGFIIVILGCLPAQATLVAQLSPDYGYNGAPMSSFINDSYLNNQQIVDDNAAGKKPGKSKTTKTNTQESLKFDEDENDVGEDTSSEDLNELRQAFKEWQESQK